MLRNSANDLLCSEPTGAAPAPIVGQLVRQDPPHAPDVQKPARGVCLPRSKAMGDWLMALVLFVLTLPVTLIVALLVKLTSRGPVLYSQVRVGHNGKPFRIHKMRTMYHECEKQSGPRWSTAGDPRVTPLGRILRKTHLDELPQLWNVLCGEMSLVGPRPERPEFTPGLEKLIPHYRERLQVRPGVTGLAQVQLPADTNLESVRRKLKYDLYYLHNVGLWLDVRLVVATALKLVGVHSSLLVRLLRLPGRTVVEGVAREAADPAVGLQPEMV